MKELIVSLVQWMAVVVFASIVLRHFHVSEWSVGAWSVTIGWIIDKYSPLTKNV